ncbi:MAG TPA: hypothetical protein VLC55_01160, partial [Burkholderiales bacterium]|nr:hypothetical protein [Burkholderiales bacterium]
MFDWRKKPDHPMNSAEAVAQQLAELPANDPAKALDEISSWVDSVAEAAGFKPELRAAVLEALDEAGQRHHDKLLADYLSSPQLYDFKVQARWQKIYAFWNHLLDAYVKAATELDAPAQKAGAARDALPLLLCRGLRAGAEAAKCRRLNYHTVENATWERLCRLYALAERAQVTANEVKAYKSEPLPSTPAGEFTRALMLEFGTPQELAPEHVELAFRITARVASSYAIAAQPAPGLRFCVDLAQGTPPSDCARFTPGPGGSPRYFGPGTALARLDEIIKHNDEHVLPTERRFGRDFSVWDKMTVLRHLLAQWSEQRPTRREERVPAEGELAVLNGFNAIRVVVPQTDTAQMETIAETMKERGSLMIAAETLDQAPESWVLKDLSPSGIAADAPPRPDLWVKVGKMCAVKPPSSKTWWVGVVRRLDASSRRALRVGIELLTRRPHAVWLKFVGEGQTAAANWETS